MKLHIVVRFQFVGIHNWPNAPQDLPEAYLAYPHRHTFFVEAVKAVNHEERDIEFIAFQNEMKAYCWAHFGDSHAKSCETMAVTLVNEFGLVRCSVFEDNENGAEVHA